VREKREAPATPSRRKGAVGRIIRAGAQGREPGEKRRKEHGAGERAATHRSRPRSKESHPTELFSRQGEGKKGSGGSSVAIAEGCWEKRYSLWKNYEGHLERDQLKKHGAARPYAADRSLHLEGTVTITTSVAGRGQGQRAHIRAEWGAYIVQHDHPFKKDPNCSRAGVQRMRAPGTGR